MTTDTSEPAVTPFDLVGGEASVDRLVEAFYRRMDALPEARGIRMMHEADLTRTKSVLKQYLGEWLGGPKLYSQARGHPRLRMRHMAFRIGAAERDQWMLCMRGALAEVVTDDMMSEQLQRSFYELADWVRNDQGSHHDKH